MRYFYDTEFIEAGPDLPLRLISIGIVAEDGREYYAQDESVRVLNWAAYPWLRDNVLPHLEPDRWRSRAEIRSGIQSLVQGDEAIRWVGYYADYDHVLLCQLFGRMIDLPRGWPMWTWDLKQWASENEVRFPKQTDNEHHALADARWTKAMFDRFVGK